MKEGRLKYAELSNYDEEAGPLLFEGQVVGDWREEHDSALGTYKYINLNTKLPIRPEDNIQTQFHDHYFSEQDIIDNILKIRKRGKPNAFNR